MDEFIKQLDPNLDYISHEIKDGKCYITVTSNRKEVTCPFCGWPSSRIHSTYNRTFQDLPIQGNKVFIIIRNRKFFCDNSDCNHTTFAERFDFISYKAKKTRRLEDEIVRLSINCSSITASKILKENVVDIGKSTVCNLLKKKETPVIDKKTITAVCIDDFAIKKRRSYGTIMVDIFTHQILDMIDSRDYETVCEWLKSYPNLRIISRDGSVTYNNAITGAHPEALQISDRFHLLKNLSSYVTEYLKKRLKPQVSIQSVSQEIKEVETIKQANENRKLTLKEKYEKIKQLSLEGRCKTEICRSLNMDIRAYDKLIAMTPEEREKLFQTKNMIIHEEKVKQKMERINEVRELKRIGLSNIEISRRTGLDRKTVRRYLDENFNPVHASYGKKRNGKLTPYIKTIDEYLERGMMGSYIVEKIREMGYDGSSSTVRHYMTDWKKRRKKYYDRSREDGTKTEIIKRENIFKLLYHPIEKVKIISEKQFEMICKEYPFFEKIYKVTWEFKDMLTNKNIEAFDKWIERAKNLNIPEINSFINGVERDMEAVRNAIKYEYSNGLVEGCINKLKVIKRIMYGRCSFETLKTKILQLEKMRLFN